MKDLVSGVLAFCIAGLTVLIIYDVYYNHSTDPADIYQRHSQVMHVLINLMSTVTGYYFGRIPAEAHAAGMQEVANTAQKASQYAQAQIFDAAQQAAKSAVAEGVAVAGKDRILNEVQSLRQNISRSPLGGGANMNPDIDFVIKEIDRILNENR